MKVRFSTNNHDCKTVSLKPKEDILQLQAKATSTTTVHLGNDEWSFVLLIVE